MVEARILWALGISMVTAIPDSASVRLFEPAVEVSVVMPCLNEAATVGQCIAKAWAGLERSGVHGEVIVADNGSTDGSQDIARRLGACVVEVPRKGYGSAIQGGIKAARGDLIIMGDADD